MTPTWGDAEPPREDRIITDWRSRLIALDVRPSTLRRPTFVEVEMGEFVEAHRHQCEPPIAAGAALMTAGRATVEGRS